MPLTSACESRSSTGALRHASSSTGVFPLRFHAFGEIDQPLGRVVAPVEEHIFDALAQFRLDLFVNRELAGIDDRHVEPGPDGVIQKRRMHRFAHGVVAAKGKRNVADAAADARAGQVRFDPARRLDEIDRVIAMLLEAGRDRQDVRIENDVVRRKAGALGQEPVGARADFDLAAASCRPGRFRRTPSRSRPRRIAGRVAPGAEIPLRRS